ncbi:hypothetical protein DFH11DRAFT_1544986 [Phellopilus nigrolimitatus]|nr:hypothetical protein DFH11DRAFT_1544986 [Phellopilus nigrolimitatus]
MTFSVDDLVASLSSNHIGQEAIDLATLQAQLAQTLAYSQQQQHHQAASAQGHCNTPTARTPTTSFANWSVLEQRRSRSSSSASAVPRKGSFSGCDSDMIMEENMDADDEYAVEQLVGSGAGPAYSDPSSPIRYRERSDTLYMQNQAHAYTHPSNQNQARYAYANADAMFDCTSPTASSFARSDPFYAAAEASSRQAHQATQNSFFAQIGRPAQHSPFYAAQAAATPQGAF